MDISRDIQWPDLGPSAFLRKSPSTPSLSVLSAKHHIRSGGKGHSRMGIPVEDNTNHSEQPMRLLSPRPQVESDKTLLQTSKIKFNKDAITFEAPLEGENQDIRADLERYLLRSRLLVPKQSSVSPLSEELPDPALELTLSRTISPLSHDSINDLLQSRPDSPFLGESPALFPGHLLAKPTPMACCEDLEYPTALLGNMLPLLAKGQPPAFDGPALDVVPAPNKEFGHLPGDCPTISEDDEIPSETAIPLRPIASMHHLAYSDSFINPSLPHRPSVPCLPGISQIPGIEMPSTPGVPVDVTGIAPNPPMPASNLSKSQRAKSRGEKVIRKSRRIFLRKSILSVIVGRQLAGPTCEVLKYISRGIPVDMGDFSKVKPELLPGRLPF